MFRGEGMFEKMLQRGKSDRVLQIPIVKIVPNPAQPRRAFSRRELEELAHSISAHGIIQPLLVRKIDGGYELVAGERRLRAAVLVGYDAVPCVVAGIDASESALFALIENMQRCDLNFFEEAEGVERLINEFGITQEQAARMLSKSQSAISNKLRLLRLNPRDRRRILQAGLTERHARALLQLIETDDLNKAMDYIIKYKLNVEASERYINSILQINDQIERKIVPIIKDMRIFINTITHAVDVAKEAGLAASIETVETEDCTRIVIMLPGKKKRPAAAQG